MYVRLIYIYIIVRGFVFKNDCPRKIVTGSLRGHSKRHGRPLFVLVTIRNHSWSHWLAYRRPKNNRTPSYCSWAQYITACMLSCLLGRRTVKPVDRVRVSFSIIFDGRRDSNARYSVRARVLLRFRIVTGFCRTKSIGRRSTHCPVGRASVSSPHVYRPNQT